MQYNSTSRLSHRYRQGSQGHPEISANPPRITMYKLNLSTDTSLKKTHTALRTTRSHSTQSHPHPRYLPNLSLVSQVLQLDQQLWRKNRDPADDKGTGKGRRNLYEILDQRRKKRQREQVMGGLIGGKGYCTNFGFFWQGGTRDLGKSGGSRRGKAENKINFVQP